MAKTEQLSRHLLTRTAWNKPKRTLLAQQCKFVTSLLSINNEHRHVADAQFFYDWSGGLKFGSGSHLIDESLTNVFDRPAIIDMPH